MPKVTKSVITRFSLRTPRAKNSESERVLLIVPVSGWVPLNLREMWAYRELLYFLIWRDIKVRYKQTLLGAAWAIIQPLFTMVIFSIFFGGLAKIPSDDIPYPIFSYTGLLPWTFFATALTNASRSLVRDANLLKRVYFPRLVIPLAGVVGALPDFFLAFLVLLGMMVYYGIYPTAVSLLWLVPLLLLAMLAALGIGLWLSALYVRYRDVGYIVPFLIQSWMYLTPVAYPSSLLEEPWRTLYGLNPMAGVVEGFRWALLHKGPPPGAMTAVSALTTLVLVISGLYFFRRMEHIFADVV